MDLEDTASFVGNGCNASVLDSRVHECPIFALLQGEDD
jgi:hypothetical protein